MGGWNAVETRKHAHRRVVGNAINFNENCSSCMREINAINVDDEHVVCEDVNADDDHDDVSRKRTYESNKSYQVGLSQIAMCTVLSCFLTVFDCVRWFSMFRDCIGHGFESVCSIFSCGFGEGEGTGASFRCASPFWLKPL